MLDHRSENLRYMCLGIRRNSHMLLAERMDTDGKHEKVRLVTTVEYCVFAI
jgi:hypothetical protein